MVKYKNFRKVLKAILFCWIAIWACPLLGQASAASVYKAASQQLLDRWKKKRMTGLRFSWKIENPPLMTKIREVGRSIQTPNFGNTLKKDTGASSDRVYKAILSPPRDLLQQSENDFSGRLRFPTMGRIFIWRLQQER